MAALLSGHGRSPVIHRSPLHPAGAAKAWDPETRNRHRDPGARNCHNFMVAPTKFYTANPKLYTAFLAAFQEATIIINQDKRAAAELYIKVTRTRPRR